MASTTPTSNDPNAVYSLGHNASESQRLQRQADELFDQSAALVDRTALGPGGSCIDVGCGPRGILDLLAQRVGPEGRVVGVDADPDHVAMATQMAADRNLDWVSVVQDDARHTSLPSSSFDVVHGRTILITVPEPLELVLEMARLAKPGGWVIGLEPDPEPSICAHLDNPDVIVMPGVNFLVSGRKPEGG